MIWVMKILNLFFYRYNLTLEQYIKDVTGDNRILNGKITSMGKKTENTTKEEDKRKLLIEYKDTLKDVMKAKKKNLHYWKRYW